MTVEKIIEILAEQLNIDKSKITEETRIIEDLGADSLDMVELLMTLEEEHGISISNEDAVNIKTIKDIADIISKKQ